ncbi:acetyl-coenzyme A transporter 1-like [Drosophila takahashii]|uniref:acetyl-coenzyme A transporter 1-like n=1 Tax=Drosophila takahashii TaxID=29030 RepID=UPI001CF86E37|nr:acetyl-coenzyme A transporter 1-like [Drosophila takahashii]
MSTTEKIPPKGDTTVIVEEKTEEQQPEIREDLWKLVRLVFLYALLGIPIALTGVIARLHKNGGVAHIELVMLFAPWAFIWKLFWTPFLNCPIIHSLGRRISWVFAAYGQFIILVILSLYADTRLIENGGASTYLVLLLALMFSMIYFLVAIQTIEVYRWASTMLRPCNLRYNSICNSVGQNVGYYMVLAAWKSKDFCNKYLSSAFLEEEIITLPRFLFIFGLIFLVATYLVAFFKKDAHQEPTTENELKTQDLSKLVKTSQAQKLAGVLLAYIFITPLSAVGSPNQPEEIFYMKTIVLASKRILMMMAKCLTGPGLEDISKTAIPYPTILFT